ncbi:hypothetical protein Tco_0212613 [Tanacetum coccineum]
MVKEGSVLGPTKSPSPGIEVDRAKVDVIAKLPSPDYRERFQQRFDETFYEAWDRFNDLLRACPHHGFSELHQLDTFYNALNSNDQDSLNSAALIGNFLDKMPRDCLRIIESKSKVRNSRNKPVVAKVSSSTSTPGISSEVAELKDMVKALLLDKKNQSPAPTPVKAVVQPPAYQAPAYQAPAPQTQGVSKTDFDSYVKANDAVMRNMQNQNQVLQTQGQNLQAQLNNLATSNQRLESMLGNFIKMNTASTSGTLPSNTVTNPKEDLKGITTRSGVAYKGPTIHTTSSPKVVEREPMSTMDRCLLLITGSTGRHPPPVVLLSIMNQSLSPAKRSTNRIHLIVMACGDYSQKFMDFSKGVLEWQSTPYYDPIISTTSPTLTPFEGLIIVYTDHSAIKYLFAKKDAKPRLMRWILLSKNLGCCHMPRQKREAKISGVDHLSRLENPHQDKLENKEITKTFPFETLGSVALHVDSTPWFADFANYHAGNFIVKGMSSQ